MTEHIMEFTTDIKLNVVPRFSWPRQRPSPVGQLSLSQDMDYSPEQAAQCLCSTLATIQDPYNAASRLAVPR